MIKLEWKLRSPSLVNTSTSPLISTSLTTNESEELRKFSGREVLEIGSAYGYSAIVMALSGAHVYAVDPHTWIHDSHTTMLNNVEAYGVQDLIIIRTGYSFDVLPELVAQNILFDMVWIDGDHEAGTVAHDVGMAVKLLKPDGYLLCHDYDEATCPGVKTALDAWLPPTRLVDTMAIYGPDQWRR